MEKHGVTVPLPDNERQQPMANKEPWKERCVYVTESGAPCHSVTPRDWSHCPNHTGKLGQLLDESRGTVTLTLDLPELGKQIGELNSADWESIRLRLTRTASTVTL
jgi:hypothetical protein